MNFSQLTVNDVRIQIGSLFAAGDFLPYLNQALLSLLQSGRWKGSLQYTDFPLSVTTGYLTLPYPLQSIMGISAGGVPLPVFGSLHEFMLSGPGRIDETKPATGILDFINDNFPVRLDIPTPSSTLRIALTNVADVGKTWRLYGTDENDREIFDAIGMGINVVTSGVNTDTTQKFNTITGIQCPVTAAGYSNVAYPWRLYGVDPVAVATELSYYYPNESRPSYARYKIGTWNDNSSDQLTIRTLCQRRFIPVCKDTDYVTPEQIRAIKAAMQAVQNEDANNYKEAEPLWNAAIAALNNEVHSARGAAKPEISIPQAQFDYDGGCWGYGWGGSFAP